MLPCQPAPVELQVLFGAEPRGRLAGGTLRCLKFLNGAKHSDQQKDHGGAAPWLTFGLLYDIVEEIWFRCNPRRVTSVIFDYTFRDPPGPHEPSFGMYCNNLKIQLRAAIPQIHIGGAGKVLVHLTNDE